MEALSIAIPPTESMCISALFMYVQCFFTEQEHHHDGHDRHIVLYFVCLYIDTLAEHIMYNGLATSYELYH